MGGPDFDVIGEQEVAANLARLPATIDRVAAALGAPVGVELLEVARRAGAGGSAQQAAAVLGITGASSADAAAIALGNNSGAPFAGGAYFGALQYRQFPAWVGEAWDIETGSGPYEVAPAIAAELPRVRRTYEEATARAIEQLGLAVT